MQRSLEEVIGTRWMTWVGSVAVFVAAAFFLQVAIARGWIGPGARIALALGFGGVLGALGNVALVRRMRPLGQGLIGTGAAVQLLALHAGLHAYHLYSPEVAFGALVLVTASTMALALWHDAHALALLALAGGFATPVIVHTGADQVHALCTYLAILDGGVLAVSFARRWRLDLLAAPATWLLLAAGHATLPWIAAFFVIFAITPFGFHLRRRVPLDAGRFVVALVHAAVSFGLIAHVLDARAPIGHAALILAATYLALGAVARVRLPDDVRAQEGFLALAACFATLAVALHLHGQAATAGLALEVPALAFLGRRFRSSSVQLAALVVLVAALGRLFLLDWPVPSLAAGLVVPFGAALAAFAQRGRVEGAVCALIAAAVTAVLVQHELHFANAPQVVWIATALVCVLAGRGAVMWRVAALAALTVAAAYVIHDYAVRTDTLAFLNARFAVAAAGVAVALQVSRRFPMVAVALGLAWALTSVELARHVAEVQTALTVWWSTVAIALCAAGFRLRARWVRLAGLGLFAVTAVKLVAVDLAAVDQLYRVASFLALGLLMIGASFLYARSAARR